MAVSHLAVNAPRKLFPAVFVKQVDLRLPFIQANALVSRYIIFLKIIQYNVCVYVCGCVY